MEEFVESPAKRRRLSLMQDHPPLMDELPSDVEDGAIARMATKGSNKERIADEDANITISSTSKLASQTVAPFLAKHIPAQYAPLGGSTHSNGSDAEISNTKYCYRHRPDLKCRRQANEPSMDQLQHELETLSKDDQQGIAHVWTLFSAAPSKHRNLMLQGILTQCCFPQLSYLSTHVRELIRIDFLTALPTELSFKILCFLDTTSLCKAAQVSQRWRMLADDDVVWHRMCEQHIDRKCIKCGWGLPLLERKRLRASKRQIQLRATGRGLNVWSPNITPYPENRSQDVSSMAEDIPAKLEDPEALSDGPFVKRKRCTGGIHSSGQLRESSDLKDSYFRPRFRPWKDVYKDRFKVGSNWKHGRYSIRTFKGHSNGIMCLQFDDHILATGSYDATIKIWNTETGGAIRTLRGHTSTVRCLQFDDTKLISGSMDTFIKIWNWRTGECLTTYSGHKDGVISLHFDSGILASGSVDKTVRMWNFEDKSTCVLRGHEDWVNAVRVDAASRTVFSASDDCTVRLWDLDTKSTIRIFKGHVGQVQQVLPLPMEFDLEDSDDEIHMGDQDDTTSTSSSSHPRAASPLSLASTVAGDFAWSDRPLPPRYMLTSALDSTIRLWNVSTGKCLRTFFGHIEGVWALGADTLRVVSGAEDRTVKIWDARTGRCERTITGHAGAVTCIGLSDSRMCTGSEDCEVRMYSFKPEVQASGTVEDDESD